MSPYLNYNQNSLLINKNIFFFINFYILTFAFFFCFNNWFSLWVVLEINNLIFLGILIWNLKRRNIERIIIFFIIQALRSLFLLFFLRRNNFFFNNFLGLSITPIQIILFLKIAIAPLHNWFIPVVLNSITTITWLLLSLQKLPYLIFFFLISNHLNPLIILFLYSNILIRRIRNIKQNIFKIIITFSGISQLRWVLRARRITSGWQFFFLSYSLLLIFFVFLREENKKRLLEQKSFLTILFLLSIRGLPPFFLFFPKITLLWLVIKRITIFIFFILIISLIDLYIYSRICILLLIKTNLKKWNWKKNSVIKSLLRINLIIILIF